jgi:hypothetical protein
MKLYKLLIYYSLLIYFMVKIIIQVYIHHYFFFFGLYEPFRREVLNGGDIVPQWALKYHWGALNYFWAVGGR